MTKEMIAERAIVLQVLRDDHAELWNRAELERELSDLPPLIVNGALESLAAVGAVLLEGESACASAQLRHLDDLEMIAV